MTGLEQAFENGLFEVQRDGEPVMVHRSALTDCERTLQMWVVETLIADRRQRVDPVAIADLRELRAELKRLGLETPLTSTVQ